MDVRCERCSTLYDFDDSRIPAEGLSVKCSSCGYVFRVYRSIVPHGGEEWMVRQNKQGKIVRFKEMTTLQRWVVERKVARDDEISRTGQTWKRLGEIPDLEPFFRAVEGAAPAMAPAGPPAGVAPAPVAPAPGMPAAPGMPGQPPYGAPAYGAGPFAAQAPGGAIRQQPASAHGALPPGASWEGAPQSLPKFPTGNWELGVPPAGAAAPAFVAQPDATGPAFDDDEDFRPPRGRGKWVVLFLLLAVGGGAAAVYVLRPDLVQPYLQKLLRPRIDTVAAQEAASAARELEKDSYAAIARARGMYERAVTLDGRYAAAKAGLAEAELARAEYLLEETSELEARKAAAPGPEDAQLAAGIAERTKEARERTEHAFALAKEAIELEPDGADGLRAMADYYRIMKTPESMKPLLEKAREKAPTDAWVAYVYGASVAGDPALAERAIRWFDEALEAAPDLQRARYAMARVFLAQGNKAKAQLHAETILKAVPDHERARALLAELSPPPAPAAAPAAEPKQKEPTLEQVYARADRLRESDKPEQALKLYEHAAELSPQDPDAYTGMGWCYYDMERYDPAIANFNRALQLVPRFSDAHFGIAEAYQAKGMKRDAVKHYRAYLDITPDGEDAEIAKRQLEALQQ